MNPVFPVVEQRSVRWQRRRLVGFVLGSLLLHVLLVAVWRGQSPAGPVGRSSFQVTLVARHGDTPQKPAAQQQQARNNEPHHASKRSALSGDHSVSVSDNSKLPVLTTDAAAPVQLVTRAVKSASKAVSKAAAEELPQATTTSEVFAPGSMNAASGSTSHGQHELTSAARYRRVRDELLRALLPHFEYPPVARRRGWQGRVRIGLLLKADGHLSHVQLVESSGYALLDKAAMKNVNQLRDVPAASRWLGGRDMDVILPVSYRLEDR